MDATDRAVIVRAILNNNSDNYLYDYLTRREEQSSITEDCQLEHDGYLATLQKIVNYEANAKIAVVTDKFEVRRLSQARASYGCSCNELLVQLRSSDIELHFIQQEHLMAVLVMIFWLG
ncbi:10099_t:CDS:2 [Funneliformis mosseae]|uniref:10099_t:CDS:1 n=1 Tax=Funneliformis mosseae TaxID=27381 RepID=A0A9N9IFJ3_FUNMO|nr:10099_t:CDS:2 [Funneliformis mosseae]